MRIRPIVPRIALALACASLVLFFGTRDRDVFWTDFFVEAWPAYLGMRAGGLAELLHLAPAYAGFVTLIGAPLSLFGLGLDGTYRLDAIPGLLVLCGFAVSLHASDRKQMLLATVLAAGCPIAFFTLAAGHPEDLLAGAAGAAGVLAAVRGRATLSAVLIALAVVAKQTAVLAFLPAVLALPRPKLRSFVIPIATAALVYGVLHFLRPPGAQLGVGAGSFFHPWQIWWPLGVPSDPAWMAAGHGSITSPAWLAPIPHPLIVGLSLPLSALWWWRAGHDRPREDALALFALLALERCMLDPWNLGYYHFPLVLALLAWETEKRRLPAVTLAVVGAIWLTFHTLAFRSGIQPMLIYMAWSLPLGAMLIRALYARTAPARKLVPAFA